MQMTPFALLVEALPKSKRFSGALGAHGWVIDSTTCDEELATAGELGLVSVVEARSESGSDSARDGQRETKGRRLARKRAGLARRRRNDFVERQIGSLSYWIELRGEWVKTRPVPWTWV